MMKLIQRLLVAGGLAYVALTGTPSPNCSSGSRVVDEAVRPNAMYEMKQVVDRAERMRHGNILHLIREDRETCCRQLIQLSCARKLSPMPPVSSYAGVRRTSSLSS